MNKQTIAAWCLFDFANSIYYAVIPATIWSAYYATVIVGNESGQGDLWWGRVISTSMLVIAVTSPIMGAIADVIGIRKRLLIAYTLIAVTATCLLSTVEAGMVFLGFILSVISYIGTEGGQIFYNAYLPEIAPPDRRGRVSGWGFAVGYAGSMMALLMVLPLIQGGHLAPAFLLVGTGFLVFALPAFLWLPADRPNYQSILGVAGAGWRMTRETLRSLRYLPQVRRFLLAYFFYEDGVNTVINTAAVFAATTLGFQFAELIGLFATVQLSALIGAWLWAKPTDVLGPKRVVLIMLVQWAAVVTLAYFVETKTHFFAIAVLAGSGLGAVQAASRAFMASLIPPGREGEFFGLYALCGKTASIMGPLVFGMLSSHTGGNQRLSILSVIAFYVIGGLLLCRVRAGGPPNR
ncbi:MAG TPA: MFS transporter [Blastocatellia bacterium]|nr:MFS transporter [Blastocatellia bacterium]